VVNIVNSGTLGGGYRHYSGLLPANPGNMGGQASTSVRIFHVPATNAAALFRGDIVVWATGSIGVPGAGDLPQNIGTPSTASVVIGNGGGTLLGNASMAPNISRWVPGDTTSIIAGIIVGWGPITLYQAKNGFQYAPASTECWAFVETDPMVVMTATMPTVPATAFNLILGDGVDVKANAGQQTTRFGISGVSLDPASFQTTSTLPLRLLNSSEQIGNDPTAAGFVAEVQFNLTRHYRGTAAFGAD
jgi:hypothetical protein